MFACLITHSGSKPVHIPAYTQNSLNACGGEDPATQSLHSHLEIDKLRQWLQAKTV